MREMFGHRERILSYQDSDSTKSQAQKQKYKTLIDSLYTKIDRLHRDFDEREFNLHCLLDESTAHWKQMRENTLEHQRHFDHLTVS